MGLVTYEQLRKARERRAQRSGAADPHDGHDAEPEGVRPLTDLGNAERLCAEHGADLRFTAGLGWLAFDGKVWARDETGERMRRAKATVRRLYAEAARIESESVRKAVSEWARKSESAEKLSAMLRLAETEPGIAVAMSDLDRAPWLLNVQNGTVDLRTGTLRPHDRADLITRIAGTHFDPAATCPTFDTFLDCIFAGNAELIAFLQRWFGYCLTGDVREQKLLFCFGTGANGKSTLIELIIALLGAVCGYARPAAPGLLLAKKHEQHPTELADLRGARLVTAVEIGDGKRFDEERVKALTGGDTIKARVMRGDFFSFTPSHKLVVAANHRPEVRGTDHAIWRRILLVPFDVTFSDAQKDTELPARLRRELPGILRWAVEGCLAWQRDGLREPRAVTDATSAYRDEQDTLGRFLDERCAKGEHASAASSALYAVYCEWSKATGEQAVTQTRFGRSLAERGYRAEHTRTGNLWRGLGVSDSGSSRWAS